METELTLPCAPSHFHSITILTTTLLMQACCMPCIIVWQASTFTTEGATGLWYSPACLVSCVFMNVGGSLPGRVMSYIYACTDCTRTTRLVVRWVQARGCKCHPGCTSPEKKFGNTPHTAHGAWRKHYWGEPERAPHRREVHARILYVCLVRPSPARRLIQNL